MRRADICVVPALFLIPLGCTENQSANAEPYVLGDAEAPHDSGVTEVDAKSAPTELANPVIATDCADPFVFYEAPTWHAFCTQIGLSVTPHYASEDLRTWRNVGNAVRDLASWIGFGQNWAPSAAKFGNTYVLYYSALRKGSEQHCLGRAVATSINGPYVDALGEPFVCTGGGYWSLDPSPFTAADGKRYLLWRQDTPAQNKGNVAIRELATDGLSFAEGSRETILLSKENGTWEDPVMENPAMINIEGKHYLFYSANAWDTASYGVGYAECDGPAGPCTKKTSKAPWLSSVFALSGPGGQDFFVDGNGNPWMSIHGWTTGKVGYANGGARSLWVYRFGIQDGVPHLSQAIAPL